MTETSIDAKIKIKFNIAELKNAVAKQFFKIVNRAFRRSISDIKIEVAAELIRAVRNSPEFKALVGGSRAPATDFEAQFGTGDIPAAMNEMVDELANQVDARFDIALSGQGKITGGIILRLIEGDFEKAANVTGGTYVSKPSSSIIPWLRWILTAGNTTIDNFGILFDLTPRQTHASRTGRAIMVSLNTIGGQQLSHWTVPPMFQGDDINSNFITRALTQPRVIRKIEQIIQNNVNRQL